MIDYDCLPLKDALDRYAKNRVPVGGFLTAMLENNFMETVGRADHVNINLLHEYASYIYNHMPMACHGSPQAVSAWLNPSKEL